MNFARLLPRVVLFCVVIVMLTGMATFVAPQPTTTALACDPCDCPDDNRENCQGSHFYAVYARANRDGCYFDAYLVNERTGRGTRAFQYTARQIAETPANPPTNQRVAGYGPNDVIALYRLTSGEWQVNAGPDAEGKIFVVRWQGCPAQNVVEESFMAPR